MVTGLVQSAHLTGHRRWACLKAVLERLLWRRNLRIDERLSHRGTAAATWA